MLTYISLLIKKLVNNEDDDNRSVESRQNLKELGVVNFNETDINLFYGVMNEEQRFVPYDKEMKKYITFEALHSRNNLGEANPEDYIKATPIGLKTCEESDFAKNNDTLLYFKEWNAIA